MYNTYLCRNVPPSILPDTYKLLLGIAHDHCNRVVCNLSQQRHIQGLSNHQCNGTDHPHIHVATAQQWTNTWIIKINRDIMAKCTFKQENIYLNQKKSSLLYLAFGCEKPIYNKSFFFSGNAMNLRQRIEDVFIHHNAFEYNGNFPIHSLLLFLQSEPIFVRVSGIFFPFDDSFESTDMM